MIVPAYEEKELTIVSETEPDPLFPSIHNYSFPVTPKEAFKAALDGHAVWELVGPEKITFCPVIIPDNKARAFVNEAVPFDGASQGGGADMFGVEWEYEPLSMGSMVRPGNPLLSDMNEWYDKIVWPDIDSWDWEGSALLNNKAFLSDERFNALMFQNGYFERMISLLDFENAAFALVDEDQAQAIHDFFGKLSDLYIALFAKCIKTYPQLDGFEIHDDWGSQQNTFFSPDIVAEFIVPYMRKVNDYIHSQGKYALCHSCGNTILQMENYIAAGYDLWNPQSMNDTALMYERYGDRIMLGIYIEPLEGASEQEQRQQARAFADCFCKPGKPSFLNMYSAQCLKPAFWEELYIRSRKNYSA